MKMRATPAPSPLLFALALAVSAFAAGDAAATGLPTPAAPAAPAGQKQALGDLPDSLNPIEHASLDGQFSITFPTGCARIYTKTNTAADGSVAPDVSLTFVNCERAGATNEGCQVIAKRGAARGLAADAARDLVLGEISKLLAGYQVTPARQNPVQRDFGPHGKAEGLDVQAHPQSGAGDVWIRGLLRGDDVFLILAWKAAGGLFEDPEYGLFFQSFRPWVDEAAAQEAAKTGK